MSNGIIDGVERNVPMNALTVTEPANVDAIRSRILTIRGVQVMLDRDLAELYGVPTKRLNEQVKRNARRFPDNFMFQLTKEELGDWRSQIATSNVGDGTGRSHLVTVNSENWRSQIATSNLEQYAKMGVRNRPYAFTEHGIIMLASVLKSDIAIDASIRITNAFIAMRKALSSIAPLMARIAETERLQLEEKTARLTDQARNEERFKLILDAMQDKKFPPQKVFYDGQIYDAFEQMKKFVRMAKTELIIIDPYFADCVLPLIAQKRQGVAVLAVKNSRNKLLHAVDVAKFNAQYANSLTVKTSDKFHDRFLIIDKTTLIHVNAPQKRLRFGGKICRRQTRRAPKRPRCVAQPSWQEVFRVFIPRQVKYPRHTGEDITGRGKGRSPFNRVSRGLFPCVQRGGGGWI